MGFFIYTRKRKIEDTGLNIPFFCKVSKGVQVLFVVSRCVLCLLEHRGPFSIITRLSGSAATPSSWRGQGAAAEHRPDRCEAPTR